MKRIYLYLLIGLLMIGLTSENRAQSFNDLTKMIHSDTRRIDIVNDGINTTN